MSDFIKITSQLFSFLVIAIIAILFIWFGIQNQKAKCESQKNQEIKSVECQINHQLN